MTLTPPTHYRHTDEAALSNLDHSIQPGAEDRLRSEEIAMDYTAWNFYGLVWFCREKLKFCCEVSRHGKAVKTIVADTLEEIMDVVSDSYGHE